MLGGPSARVCRLGDNSNIGPYSFIGCSGYIEIGAAVLNGSARHTCSPRTTTSTHAGVPIKSQGVTRRSITIEDDCWLGAGSTVLAGVTIGHDSVVAAGAVVTRDVPPYSVVGGVPARVLRSRDAHLRGGPCGRRSTASAPRREHPCRQQLRAPGQRDRLPACDSDPLPCVVSVTRCGSSRVDNAVLDRARGLREGPSAREYRSTRASARQALRADYWPRPLDIAYIHNTVPLLTGLGLRCSTRARASSRSSTSTTTVPSA